MIKILSDEIVNKIAAGEVIERPASIVKELVENSIDAGATRIEVTVKNGGKSFIRIADNGSGMTPEDAEKCVERHATSKIAKIDDIFSISSLGFRGEALPSITSVSKFKLITKSADSPDGTELNIEGGKKASSSPAAATQGTIIEVSDLFYNVPARKKYLKTERTEFGHIQDVMIQAAFAYPEKHFKFINGIETVWDLPPSKTLKERIAFLNGKDFVSELVPFEYTQAGITVWGLLGKSSLSKVNRTGLFTFVNRRPIKSLAVNFAIYQGYKEFIMEGRFPVAYIFIDVPARTVDVNVHPAKREVRFADQRKLQGIIAQSIKENLIKTDSSPRVSTSFTAKTKSFTERIRPDRSKDADEVQKSLEGLFGKEKVAALGVDSVEAKEETSTTSLPGAERFNILNILGQISRTYIVAETKDGFSLIDQHAAHERIIYEKILKSLETGKSDSQGLLAPELIEINPKAEETFENYLPLLSQIGFEISSLGENSYSISALPPFIGEINVQNLLKDFLDELTEGNISGKYKDKKETLAATLACKREAVKAGQRLSNLEIEGLINSLSACTNPFNCPHGRPTIVKISMNELKKWFKR